MPILLSWTVPQTTPGPVVAAMHLVPIENPDRPQPPPAAPSFDMQPVRPRIVPPVLEFVAPRPVEQPPDPAGDSGTAGACNTVDRVSRALLSDASMSSLLEATPAETRSVSEAMIVWNREWTSAAGIPGGALARARRIIQSTLLGISPPCLAAEVLGPRLVLLPSRGGNMVLVIGSGSWAWGSLLEDASQKPQPHFFAQPETGGDPAPYPFRQQADQRGRIDPQRLETVDTTGERS